MQRFGACFIIMLLVVLTGCSPVVREGVVVSKVHHKAYTTNDLVMMPVGKTVALMHRKRYHPESWTITIKGLDQGGVEREEIFEASGWAEYDRYKVGQWTTNPTVK